MATKIINPPSGSQAAEATKRRYGTAAALAVHQTLLANCEVLDAREWRDIAVKPSAGITAISVHAAETEAGTYVLVDNIGTNGVVTIPASKWSTLDTTKIAPFGFLKFLSTGADGTLEVVGKT